MKKLASEFKMVKINIDGINDDKFISYEQVRLSGITNMFNIELVCELAKITRNECLYIMKNYDKLTKIFKNVIPTNNFPRKIGIVNFNKI